MLDGVSMKTLLAVAAAVGIVLAWAILRSLDALQELLRAQTELVQQQLEAAKDMGVHLAAIEDHLSIVDDAVRHPARTQQRELEAELERPLDE
jgi:hypothetical protein